MRLRTPLLAFVLLCCAQAAFSQTQGDAASTVLGLLQQSMAPAIDRLTAQAISWLAIFATLQFVITNYNLLKGDGDIQAVIAKLTGAIAWVSICLYLINNGPDFLRSVGDQFMGFLGVDLPSPGSIISKTIIMASGLVVLALGVGSIPLVGGTAGTLLLYVTLFILAVGLFFAFKIFMLQLEIGLISMLSPLSFAFLGLNTLRDQGIAPFKALISLGYRIILLVVILSGYGQVSSIMSETITSIGAETIALSGMGQALSTILSGVGAYMLLAYLSYKSDAIAATLASGATSLGTGDVAQAAATGAAMGAAVAAGGAATASTASRVPQSMSDFMGSLSGGGSISNASSVGSGSDAPSLPPPPVPASLSLGATTGGGASKGVAASAVPIGSALGSGKSNGSGGGEQTTAGAARRTSVASGRYGQEGAAPDVGGSETGGGRPRGSAADQVGTPASASAATSAAAETAAPPSGSAFSTPVRPVAQAVGPSHETSDALTVTPSPAEGEQGKPRTTGSAPAGDAVDAGAQGSQAAPGSGQTAAIAGKPGGLESEVARLVDHLATKGQGKPTLGQRLSEVGRHVSQEQAATHVSINPNQHD